MTCDFMVAIPGDDRRQGGARRDAVLRPSPWAVWAVCPAHAQAGAFLGHGDAPHLVVVTREHAAELGIPEGEVECSVEIVLEMKIVARHWRILRRHRDPALAPEHGVNSVQENIELHN